MGMIESTNRIRVDYDYEKKRWFIDTPMAMSNQQMLMVLKNAYGQLSFRVKGEVGERKREMEEALKNMTVENTDQYLIGYGEKTLYLSPERMKPKTMIIR
jgi:hypothetical protein